MPYTRPHPTLFLHIGLVPAEAVGSPGAVSGKPAEVAPDADGAMVILCKKKPD